MLTKKEIRLFGLQISLVTYMAFKSLVTYKPLYLFKITKVIVLLGIYKVWFGFGAVERRKKPREVRKKALFLLENIF
jgi:hypothetical protein